MCVWNRGPILFPYRHHATESLEPLVEEILFSLDAAVNAEAVCNNNFFII